MADQPTRRDFFKKAATLGAAGIGGSLGINAIAPSLLREKPVFEENRSFWATALPPQNPSLDRDLVTNVAIIGGGFLGLSAAYYLRKTWPEREVVVLEAKRCGNGASGRNGAMLLTMTDDRFMTWSGEPELDKRIYELTVDNIRRLGNLSASAGVDAEIEQNGALQVCNTKQDLEAGRDYIEKMRTHGLPLEFWNDEKVAEAVGTTVYHGGLFDPNSGQLHPGKLVNLFKVVAQRQGAKIHESTTITNIDEGETLRLTTEDGKTVEAKAVVLATNAYTAKLGYLRRAVAPLFDYVGITAPLGTTELAATGWRRRIPFNDSRTEVFYLGLTKDNRIHIGGGPADYEFNNGLENPQGAARRYDQLLRELTRIYPSLAGAPLEICWSGAVDMSLDRTAAVGRMGKHGNVYYGLGFSGHGLNLTSVFGRILADLIGERDGQWDWFPYLNHMPLYMPNEPFRWLGVQAALEYYKLSL
jgi:glycine/D-amino acid oxidase-like deaminating enzyme